MRRAVKFFAAAALCFAAALILSAACAAGEARYVKITAQEAKARMDAGRAAVLDVRTKEEYDEKHIPCALLIPYDMIEKGAPRLLPDTAARGGAAPSRRRSSRKWATRAYSTSAA